MYIYIYTKLALLVMRDGIDGMAAVEEVTASGVQV